MASRHDTHPRWPGTPLILPPRRQHWRSRRAAFAAAVLFAASLVACSSGSPSEGPLPQVESAIALRDVVDGAATHATTIEVTFDRDFSLAPRKVPLASAFDVYVPSISGGSPRRVLVDDAAEVPGTPRVMRLLVRQAVPDGSELRVARNLFHRDESGDIRGTITGELSPVLAALASAAMVLTDQSVAAPGQTAATAAEDRDAAAMRAALEAHLRKRGAPDDVRSRALARYDAISVQAVPSPKMRAALAALTGTFAEVAIDNLLTAENCTGKPARAIVFQAPPEAPDLAARVTFARDGARVVSLNPFLEGERIEHIMPFLVHEAVHCDAVAGLFEEIGATAFDTFFYLHMVAIDPTVARSGTRAAREQNIDAIAMVNSGRRFPELIGVLQAEGVEQVLPGSNSPHTSFGSLVAAAYAGVGSNESPDEPLAQQYVAILADEAGLPVVSAFNLRYLDELLARAMDLSLYADVLAALALAPGRP